MKFNELPENTQHIAANALAELIKQSLPQEEQAKVLARSVKSAFIELYCDEVSLEVTINVASS